MAELDHVVLGARTLEEGAEFVERELGLRPGPGGRHEGIGTHNLLLGLGPERYLEVIAPDPAQPEPAHPRPFGLDEPGLRTALEAGPRLIAWVARTPVLDAVATRLGASHAGEVRPWRRGELSWRMAMPPSGQSMGGLIPALIQWDDGRGAAPLLAESGLRLLALEAEHPDPDHLRTALAARGLEEAVRLRRSSHPRLLARLARADGSEVLLRGG